MHICPWHISAPGQATQAAPPVPQFCFAVPGSQVVPLQHPVEQLVALQTQAPLTHCWPMAHGAPMPQAHIPIELHVSDWMPQLTQADPAIPQVLTDLELQVDPAQQPLAQELSL